MVLKINLLYRYGIKQKTLCGEGAHVDDEVCQNWIKNTLPNLLEGYSPENVFNVDETGLFFKCLPQKTLAFKNEKCHGGKKSKERVTLMVGSNMAGDEKLKLLVIGKSAKPRCFKGIQSLPVDYFNNKNSWMTGELFQKWIIKEDQKFMRQGRKVLFFLDNCQAHPPMVQIYLKAIKLKFFPPNTTSILQPMDQGVIQNLKVHYRHRFLQRVLEAMDQGREYKSNLLDAITDVYKAWCVDVKTSTIRNCFNKAGFGTFDNWSDEDSVPLSTIRSLIIENNSNFNRVLPRSDDCPVTFDDYVAVDANVATMELPSDETILNVISSEESDSSDDNAEIEFIRRQPNDNDMRTAFDNLRSFIQTRDETSDDAYFHLSKLEDFYNKTKNKTVHVQSKIDMFLTKK